MITKRGRVLRDTAIGPGLVTVDGQQYPFSLEKNWRGDVAPTTNMVVESAFDDLGALLALRPVPTDQIAREEVARVANVAKDKAAEYSRAALDAGLPIVQRVWSEMGGLAVGALAVFLIAGLYLPALTFDIMVKFHSSFYDTLALLNGLTDFVQQREMGKTSTGLYGILFYACAFAPLLPHFVKHKSALNGYFAPLVFFVLVCVIFAIKAAAGAHSTERFDPDQMAWSMLLDGLSVSYGLFVVGASAIVLAVVGLAKLASSGSGSLGKTSTVPQNSSDWV